MSVVKAKATKRIQTEFRDMTSERSLYSVGIKSDDLFKWNATIEGPDGTPYAGGIFYVDIEFPDNYPFKPPKFTFITKIYHPNINYKGSICLDILKDKWSPTLTVEKVLLSITSLLADPNPDDPLEADIGKMFKNDRFQYDKTAREWTLKHA